MHGAAKAAMITAIHAASRPNITRPVAKIASK
jgi:hypothetical protein